MTDVTNAPETPAAGGTARPLGQAWRNLLTVSVLTLCSRILGLVREISLARLLGVSPVMDAFAFGLRIPNLSRRLFGEGALATAFIPVFSRELQQPDRQRAWQLASAALGWQALFLTGLTVCGEVLLGIWSRFPNSPETALLIELTAWMLPYLVVICLAGQVGAILNALGQFRWPGVVPIVLNLVLLLGILWWAPLTNSAADQARILAGCVLLAGVLQLAIQLPALQRAGFRWTWNWGEVRGQVWDVLAAMGPVVLGLSITQINTFTDSLIAWSLSAPPGDPTAQLALPWGTTVAYPLASGAVSVLSYGERMYQFPLGVFGVALGTVIFPLLAQHAVRKDFHALRDDLSLGLRLVLIIGIPASAGLVWLAVPITQCLFEGGRFDAAATVRTSAIIAAYGSGVWAYCAVLILQRGCYALGERLAPSRISLMAVGINLCLNLTLIWVWAEAGLAFSTATCAVLQAVALIWAIQKHTGRLDWSRLLWCAARVIAATAGMLLIGVGVMSWNSQVGLWSGKSLNLLLPCLLAGASYLVLARLLGLEEIGLFLTRRSSTAPTSSR